MFTYSEFYSGRLVARTLPFQGGEAGSIPVRSTKFCKCQQERVTLVRFLRRTELVEGNGFNSQPLGRVASVTETILD